MARIAGSQATIMDLSDSFSIALSNEAHVFEGDTNGVSGTQTTSTQIMAYQGTEPVSCFIDGTINCPDGLTVVNDEKVPFPTLSITITDKIKTAGYIDIPIKIKGNLEYTKRFSWGISKQGETGKATYLHIKYAPNNHPTAAEMTETPDKFMGEYVDNFPQDSNDPLDYIWHPWIPDPARSLLSLTKKYGLSNSMDEEPTEWFVDPPSLDVDHKFLWSKEVQEFSDHSTVELPAQVAVIYDPPCQIILESTNGTVIKNSKLNATLFVTIVYGNISINDNATMKKYFGNNAYLEWSEKKQGNSIFTPISQTDHRLSDGGFLFAINAEEILTQTTFDCKLHIPD